MNTNHGIIIALATIAALTTQGCSDQRAPTESGERATLAASVSSAESSGRYLVLFAAEQVPTDFAERVATLGATVEAALDNIGMAVVTGLAPSAAAQLAAEDGVRAVERDAITGAADHDPEASDAPGVEQWGETLSSADALPSPTTARFYPRQWNMRAVSAHEAWAAGHLGSREVVVAILDTGIDYLHPDLVGLVDLERSKSFVPEENVAARFPGRLPFSDLHFHGTAVASIVASNANVLAGVNRHVTLLAVKIANASNQSSMARMLTGIVYAADQGADVINISNGREVDKSTSPGTVAASARAVSYAFRKGALLVTVAFNDAADLDHNGDRVRLPCESATAICVSATAPTAGANADGPWENVDAPASYTAFGRSAIDVAAPGGAGAGFPLLLTKVWLPCTTTWTVTTPRPECRTNAVPPDRRVAPSLGTSFAAPHVAGLAALLVAQLGHGNPALIRARILQSADDLGEPGVDPYYGHGRINIARALGLIK